MQITEEDFVMKPATSGLFDLLLLKKVKNEETGKYERKPYKVFYGGTLSYCLRKIKWFRFENKFESETPYLLEALKEIIKLDKELVELCKESLPKDMQDGE